MIDLPFKLIVDVSDDLGEGVRVVDGVSVPRSVNYRQSK